MSPMRESTFERAICLSKVVCRRTRSNLKAHFRGVAKCGLFLSHLSSTNRSEKKKCSKFSNMDAAHAIVQFASVLECNANVCAVGFRLQWNSFQFDTLMWVVGDWNWFLFNHRIMWTVGEKENHACISKLWHKFAVRSLQTCSSQLNLPSGIRLLQPFWHTHWDPSLSLLSSFLLHMSTEHVSVSHTDACKLFWSMFIVRQNHKVLLIFRTWQPQCFCLHCWKQNTDVVGCTKMTSPTLLKKHSSKLSLAMTKASPDHPSSSQWSFGIKVLSVLHQAVAPNRCPSLPMWVHQKNHRHSSLHKCKDTVWNEVRASHWAMRKSQASSKRRPIMLHCCVPQGWCFLQSSEHQSCRQFHHPSETFLCFQRQSFNMFPLDNLLHPKPNHCWRLSKVPFLPRLSGMFTDLEGQDWISGCFEFLAMPLSNVGCVLSQSQNQHKLNPQQIVCGTMQMTTFQHLSMWRCCFFKTWIICQQAIS